MIVRQIVMWDVPTADLDVARDMLMAEFVEPRDDGPRMMSMVVEADR